MRRARFNFCCCEFHARLWVRFVSQMLLFLLAGLSVPIIVALILFFAVAGDSSGVCQISDRLNGLQVVYTVVYSLALGVMLYRSGSTQGLLPFVALYLALMVVYTGFGYSYPLDHYTASQFDFSYLLWILYAIYVMAYVFWPALLTFECARGQGSNQVTGTSQRP